MDSRRRARKVAATSANELEPAYLLHGANHALSEISASLLVDQLARFEDQARRRASSAGAFVQDLENSGWRPAIDPGALASGAFYGIAVQIPDGVGTPDEVVAAVHAKTGLTLGRVYPPLPESPLYLPETIKQYAALIVPPAPTPTSQRWHRDYVVVPHSVFLADPQQVHGLAIAMGDLASSATSVHAAAERQDPLLTSSHERWLPVIDVVVITTGHRSTLEAALMSIVKQDVEAEIRTTLWVDGPEFELPPVLSELRAQVIRTVDERRAPTDPFERVAMLRDLAVRRCTGDYVAFLDDDNAWERDHLGSLLNTAMAGYPAVHSWRLLVDPEGRPTTVHRLPWIIDNDKAVARLTELRSAGVMDDSPIVRDNTDFRLADGTQGMVDMGEWLIERRLLRLLGFGRPRSAQEIEKRIGDDDILLEQLIHLDVPVRCTRKATLRYRLGGMSNTEHRIDP